MWMEGSRHLKDLINQFLAACRKFSRLIIDYTGSPPSDVKEIVWVYGWACPTLEPGKWLFSLMVFYDGFQIHAVVKHRDSDHFLGTDFLCSVVYLTVELCKNSLRIRKRTWALKRWSDAPKSYASQWQSWASNPVHWLKPVSFMLQTVALAEHLDWGHTMFLGLMGSNRVGPTPWSLLS